MMNDFKNGVKYAFGLVAMCYASYKLGVRSENRRLWREFNLICKSIERTVNSSKEEKES